MVSNKDGIRIDNQGLALPDCYCEDYIRGKLEAGKDIHISNEFAFQVCRVLVKRIPIGSRPQITWIAYDHLLKVDDDVRLERWPEELEYHLDLLMELL